MTGTSRGIFVALLVSAFTPAAAKEISTSGGKVTGQAMADGSTIFQGIPYAAAPVGPLRWKPPQPVRRWAGVRDATKPAPPCAQMDYGWNSAMAKSGREDCLTISVRTPTLKPAAKLPVLVYIHGGSNGAGDASGLEQDAIHREGIVLVKPQYRLGVFGFLGLDSLRAEGPHRSAGNYALLDQIGALKWVKANVARFGGDPENVTISGNSAGGTDVLLLTLSPLTTGQFKRAIVQAAAPGAPLMPAESNRIGNVLLDRLKLPHGPAGLARLRTMPATELIAAAKDLPTPAGVDPSFLWEMQIVDGHVLPDTMSRLYAKGAGMGIPLIIGSNRQELGMYRKPETGPALIKSAFGEQAVRALQLYGYGERATPVADPLLGSIPTQVMTDAWFRCPVNWITERARAATPNVWRYEFGFGAPGTDKPPEHTSEMSYVYGAVPAGAKPREWPPVQRYWANFIRTGSPNGEGLPHWPPVGTTGTYLSMEPRGTKAMHGLRTEICDLMYESNDSPHSPALRTEPLF